MMKPLPLLTPVAAGPKDSRCRHLTSKTAVPAEARRFRLDIASYGDVGRHCLIDKGRGCGPPAIVADRENRRRLAGFAGAVGLSRFLRCGIVPADMGFITRRQHLS